VVGVDGRLLGEVFRPLDVDGVDGKLVVKYAGSPSESEPGSDSGY